MTRQPYDAWHGLLALAELDDQPGWAKIQPVDATTCVLEYPDGDIARVVFKYGEWHFAVSPPPRDAATATGMYDR